MVSGTGERTIASWAALTLIVGLSLSAAPAANAATDEVGDSETQTTLNTTDPAPQTTLEESGAATGPGEPPDESDEAEDDDGTGIPTPGNETTTGSPTSSPSPTPTSTPTPSESPEPGPTGPTDPTAPSPTDEGSAAPGESESTDATDSEEPALEFSCDGGLVSPGDRLESPCTVPSGFELSIPHPNSNTGGVAELNGDSVVYTAPASAHGTVPDPFTVHANGPDGTLEIQVIFTIQGGPNGDPTGEPTPDPEPPQSSSPPPEPPSPTPTDPDPPEPTGTNPSSDREPDTSDDAQSAGAPSDIPGMPPRGGPDNPPDAHSSLMPFLPIPGMPAPSAQSLTPEPSAEAEDDAARDVEESSGERDSDDDGETLAQTGPGQMAWAGSLAMTALVLGTVALSSARRQNQRSSGL